MDSITKFPTKPIITRLPTIPENITCDNECKYTYIVDTLSTLLIFDNSTKKLIYRKQLPYRSHDVYVSPNGDYLFIISEENKINKCYVYRVIQPIKLIEIDVIEDVRKIVFLSDCSTSPIDILAVSNDNKTLTRYYFGNHFNKQHEIIARKTVSFEIKFITVNHLYTQICIGSLNELILLI